MSKLSFAPRPTLMNQSQVAKFFVMWTNLSIITLVAGDAIPGPRDLIRTLWSIRLQAWSDSIWLEGSSVLWKVVTISWRGSWKKNSILLNSCWLRQGDDIFQSPCYRVHNLNSTNSTNTWKCKLAVLEQQLKGSFLWAWLFTGKRGEVQA